jgi:DNA-binding NarL/FixJ family response regulator
VNSPDEDVVRKLDTLIRLVATAICADRPQKENIGILGKAGLSPREIAEFLDTTPNTVSVALSNMRKEKGAKRRVKPSEGANE